jgi:hypothetical protein
MTFNVNDSMVQSAPFTRLILPAVIRAGSVKRRDSKHPALLRVLVASGEDTTARLKGEEDQVGVDGAELKKRKRSEKPSKKLKWAISISAL